MRVASPWDLSVSPAPSVNRVMMPQPASARCSVAKRGFRSQDKKRQIDFPKIGTSSSHRIHNHMVWRGIRSLLLRTGKRQISSAPCPRLLTAMSHNSWSFWREPKPEKYCVMSWASDTCSLRWDSGEHITWPGPVQCTRVLSNTQGSYPTHKAILV